MNVVKQVQNKDEKTKEKNTQAVSMGIKAF